MIDVSTLQTSINEVTKNITTFFGSAPNDPPSINSFDINIDVNEIYSFSLTDFTDNYTDINDILLIEVVAPPLIGQLLLGGMIVTSDQTINVSQLSQLTYIPNADEFGIGYDSFLIRVKDNGIPPNCWSDVSVITINIERVNSEPTVDDTTITINYRSTHTITLENLLSNYQDLEGDLIGYIEIESIPLNNFGILTLDNVVVSSANLPLRLTVDDIAQQRFKYIDTGEIEEFKAIGFDYTVFDNNTI